MAAVGGAWAWARSELRRNLGSTVALVLLIALSGTVVLTALAGARRTDTAFDRWLDSAHTADIRLQYSTDAAVDDDVLEALASHPDIETAQPLYITLGRSESADYDLGVFAGPDPGLFTEIDQPRVLHGRMPAPDAADEVAVNEFAASALDVQVGGRVELVTLSAEQFEQEEYDEPAGPRIDLRVVGITRLPDDVADPEFLGMFGSPAFHDRYRGEAAGFGPLVEISVRDGVDARATVEEAIAGFAFDEVELTTQQELRAQVQEGTQAVVVGLMVFAGVAAVASLVAVGQALHRRLTQAEVDQRTLHALGMTARERLAAIMLIALPTAAGGAAVAVGGAVGASRLMPIGMARRAEPQPGFDVDLVVLVLGGVAIAGVATLLGAVSAWRIRAARPDAQQRSPGEPTRWLGRLLRGGSSAPVHLGVTMALEPGAGRTAVPVRSAALGAILGVAGVVASLTVAGSVDELYTSPEQYGWSWTLAPELVDDAQLEAVAAAAGVRDVGVLVHRRVVIEDEQLLGIAVAPTKGAPTLTVLRGRMPGVADEVAIGPETADRLGLSVGDRVEAAASSGDRALTVVGEVLFPVFDDNPFNDGAALHPDAIEELAVSDGFARAIVTFDPGTPVAEAAALVEAAAPDSVSVYALPSPPPDVENLAATRMHPRWLAVFLAVLAAAAVAHALGTSVGRRRRDLGTVRALGFGRRQVRGSVWVQSATLGAAGLLVGTPLGLALGRVIWRAVADGVGVAPDGRLPLPVLAALVPATAAIALAVAVLPGRAAVRLRPAEALHAE